LLKRTNLVSVVLKMAESTALAISGLVVGLASGLGGGYLAALVKKKGEIEILTKKIEKAERDKEDADRRQTGEAETNLVTCAAVLENRLRRRNKENVAAGIPSARDELQKAVMAVGAKSRLRDLARTLGGLTATEEPEDTRCVLNETARACRSALDKPPPPPFEEAARTSVRAGAGLNQPQQGLRKS
jgi:hypothetical protein